MFSGESEEERVAQSRRKQEELAEKRRKLQKKNEEEADDPSLEGENEKLEEETYDPSLEGEDERLEEEESQIIQAMAMHSVKYGIDKGISEPLMLRLKINNLHRKIRDVYKLEKEKEEFANKMTVAITIIKDNPDLEVTEDNNLEMINLLKSLKNIIKLFGLERQSELRKSIEDSIGTVVEEIEILAPNDPNIDILFNDTDADQLVKQKIANYVTYKYNLNGIEKTIHELERKIVILKKSREKEQPQGFFSKLNQGNKNVSEDIDTKKTFYMYHIKLGKGVLGYGITSSPKRRHKEHTRNFSDNGILAEKIFQTRGETQFIEELELKIKQMFPQVDIGIDGFKNEATSYEYKDKIIDLIDSLWLIVMWPIWGEILVRVGHDGSKFDIAHEPITRGLDKLVQKNL